MKKLLIVLAILCFSASFDTSLCAEELELKCCAPFTCSLCDEIGVPNEYKITFLHHGVTPKVLIVDGDDIRVCNERTWYLGDRIYVDVPMLIERHR